MTTSKRVRTENFTKYRNKLNGTVYYGPKKPLISWIDGIKYLQVVDELATRGCLIRSEYLEKVTSHGNTSHTGR